jgi:hypothetical protein
VGQMASCSVGGPRGLVLKVDRNSSGKLVQASAKTGFKRLTIENMEKLAILKDVKLPDPRPRLEKDWAYALVRWALPHLSESEARLCVEQRSLKTTSPFTTVVNSKNLAALSKLGELDEDDVKSFEDEVGKQKLAEKIAGTAAKIVQSGSENVFIPGTAYKPKHLPNKGFTLEEARFFLPARAGVCLALHKDSSWMLKAPYRLKTPRSCSRSFDSWDVNRASLIVCLKWAWEVEKEIDPESVCPYLFDE